jgi:glycosyltransferase involved in cell wall biosynthesis
MKVLLVNYEFPPAGGGAGYATLNIAKQLRALGVEADILTAKVDHLQDGEEVEGVPVYRAASWRRGLHDCGLRGAYTFLFNAAIRRFRLHSVKHYDLEHFFFALPTGLLRLMPGPGRAIPSVISLRGSDVPGYDPFNKNVDFIHSIIKPLTRSLWSGADSVVALSGALADLARKTHPDVDYSVIPNGIDEVHFSPPAARQPASRLRLVTVARLLERKGIQVILEACANPEPLPIELTIIGTGQYQDRLQSLVMELGIGDRVRFAGYISNQELPGHYRTVDAFILPSETESFGLVFAEAMSCGLPILASNVGGIPEIVRHGVDGLLCPPARPDLLRRNIESLINDRQAQERMGKSGRQRILDYFTWSRTAKEYLRIYDTLLESAGLVTDP